MNKIIAILTQKGLLGKGIQRDTLVNIFKLEDEKVYEYDSIKLESNDNLSFSMLLKLRDISLAYIDTISEELDNMLTKLGIMTKRREDWGEDKFITQFVFG